MCPTDLTNTHRNVIGQTEMRHKTKEHNPRIWKHATASSNYKHADKIGRFCSFSSNAGQHLKNILQVLQNNTTKGKQELYLSKTWKEFYSWVFLVGGFSSWFQIPATNRGRRKGLLHPSHKPWEAFKLSWEAVGIWNTGSSAGLPSLGTGNALQLLSQPQVFPSLLSQLSTRDLPGGCSYRCATPGNPKSCPPPCHYLPWIFLEQTPSRKAAIWQWTMTQSQKQKSKQMHFSF